MKILVDARELSTKNLTGIGRYTINMIDIFKMLDFKRIYLISNTDILYDEDDKVKKIIVKNNLSFLKKFIFEKFYIKKYIEKYKIDIFFSPFYKTINYDNVYKIITVHDIGFITFPLQYYARSFIYRYFAKKSLEQSLKISDVIISVSKWTKHEILNTFNINKDKIFVLNNYISDSFMNNFHNVKSNITERNSINSNSSKCDLNNTHNTPYYTNDTIINEANLNEQEYILCVNNFKPHKNIKGLLFAYKKYYNKIRKKLVLIGGSGKWYDKVVKLINDNNISNVDVIKNISDNQLKLYYKNAELFVYPSFYEGFGLTPVEALYFGIPVACSSEASLKEVLEDAVIYFNPYDVDDMGNKIIKLLNDKWLQNMLKERYQYVIKKYSKDNIKEKFNILL